MFRVATLEIHVPFQGAISMLHVIRHTLSHSHTPCFMVMAMLRAIALLTRCVMGELGEVLAAGRGQLRSQAQNLP